MITISRGCRAMTSPMGPGPVWRPGNGPEPQCTARARGRARRCRSRYTAARRPCARALPPARRLRSRGARVRPGRAAPPAGGHTGVMSQRVRTLVRVEGIVQGVGFRPFVYSLATRLGLAGRVGNDVAGVFAEVEGPAADVREFLLSLRQDAPPLARIERITTENLRINGSSGFMIAPSESGGRRSTLVSADTAACDDCLRELADPGNRRFGYPFINCTNCGPRFTIVRDVPYDRALTTMAGFRSEEHTSELQSPVH